jgi:hypothetical protein
MTDHPSSQMPDMASMKLREGQERLLTLGVVSLVHHQRLFSPIIKTEQLRNVSAAMAESLVRHYPTLLLCDPDPLLGALELAMIIGMLTGRRHAAAIPPELAVLVRPDYETSA